MNRTLPARACCSFSPVRQGSRPPGNPGRDAMQPRRQRLALADRTGLECQDEERRLKGIFRCVLIPQSAIAYRKDHRAMPVDDGLKGLLRRFAIPHRELSKQLPIRQAADSSYLIEDVEVTNECLGCSALHHGISRRVWESFPE